ncbi:MAG: beta-lactamase family protein [Planctomycetaceae bacterium]|nr:beta-lactamase family protein [Planctomycetaceae bacterium]
MQQRKVFALTLALLTVPVGDPQGGLRRELPTIAVSRPGPQQFSLLWTLSDGADPAVQATGPQVPAGHGPTTEGIPRAVEREIAAGLFPGVVLLVGRPGRVLYHEAFGHARIVPEKVPMQKDCIFDLASVTKVVATATAFGVCVDDGTLRFGMPIRQGLPDLSGSGIDPITVDQLATHTSGFDNAKYHGRARGEAMLEQMLHASPQWEPGTRYEYSCLNMILLGRMVEKASGQGLDAFCQTRIFGPLGMRDTAFGPLRPAPRVVPSGAAEIGQIEDEQARCAGRPVGNAGLFSTAGDLARFCEMMLGAGRLDDVHILSPESHRHMTRNQLGPSLTPHGFGWEMDLQSLHRPRRLSEKAYGHSGYTGQSIWIDPEKQVYVIVLTNRNHPRMVDGERKTQQYQARARIGDAALEFLESEGQLPRELP